MLASVAGPGTAALRRRRSPPRRRLTRSLPLAAARVVVETDSNRYHATHPKDGAIVTRTAHCSSRLGVRRSRAARRRGPRRRAPLAFDVEWSESHTPKRHSTLGAIGFGDVCATPRLLQAARHRSAPEPVREIPFLPSRMIHFLDFSNEKMVAKVPDIAPTVDILLGNLEDAVPVERKEAAREGLIKVGREIDLGDTQLWTRVNSLESPWVLDDLTQLVDRDRPPARRDDGPQGRGAVGHPLRRPAAGPARGQGRPRPSRSCVHAILETAPGRRQPRGDRGRLAAHAGHELRPGRPRRLAPHEDHARRRRPSRLPRRSTTRTPRIPRRRAPAPSRTRGTTRSPAWSTRAPRSARCPSTARSATSRTSRAARRSSAPPSCSAASAPGRCTRRRSTSPRRSSRRTRTRSSSPRRSSRRSPTGAAST